MQIFLIKAAQLILALSILVLIHEFGHFLFARIFGVRVEKFYIFFDPWVELFKWKPRSYVGGLGKTKKFKNAPADEYEESEVECANAENTNPSDQDTSKGKKKKKYSFWKGTEYGIGWVPFGGYCKISGMIDESMDTEQMKQPARPWEFRSKPAWQRLLVMVAGVLFNFLLAIVIYAGIVYATGEKYVPYQNAEMGFAYSPVAHEAGFRDGDIPLTADGEKLHSPIDGHMKLIQASKVTVLRDGKEVEISIPEKFIFQLDEEKNKGEVPFMFMTYRIPTEVTQVMPGEGADKAGIKTGDRIIAVDSTQTPSLDVFLPTLAGHADKTVDITLVRGANDTIVVPVALNSGSKMGIGLEIDPSKFFKYDEKHYGLFESVPRGVQLGTEKLTSYASSMKLIFTKEGAKSVGGFGAIGSIFPEKWDWLAFWNIAAFLSVALAFMNILPIPALDGGHILFLFYEVITGRKPSEKFMEYAQWVGMILILGLLIYANGMDIYRWIVK